MHAETAYLFRHALLRDAAYQMQMPGDRAKLHELAFYLIEEAFGGRPPEPPPLDAVESPKFEPHSTDGVAAELAEHARLALADSVVFKGIADIVQVPGDAQASKTSVGDAFPVGLLRLYLRRAAEHAEQTFQEDSAASMWASLAKLVTGASRGRALQRVANSLRLLGKSQVAESVLKEGLSVLRETGNRHLEGRSLGTLASIYQSSGRVDLAEEMYRHVLDIAHELSDRDLEQRTQRHLAILNNQRGRYSQAEKILENLLAVSRESNTLREEAMTLGSLANVYIVTGRIALAEQVYERALAMHRTVGNLPFEAIELGNLGNLYADTGRVEEAKQAYAQAIQIARKIGHRHFEAHTLSSLATLFHDTHQFDQALSILEEALQLIREIQETRAEGVTLGYIANVLSDLGNIVLADQHYQLALEITREVDNRRFLGVQQCDFAIHHLRSGRVDLAGPMWIEGVVILRDLNDAAAMKSKIATMRDACAKAGIQPFDMPEEEATNESK
ncbi:MAG: tetratricopeptide repeat protein [Planctomycetes bacterium]|nr:tetratricopeptide repeat protein [Planctomycetota bacterium]